MQNKSSILRISIFYLYNIYDTKTYPTSFTMVYTQKKDLSL